MPFDIHVGLWRGNLNADFVHLSLSGDDFNYMHEISQKHNLQIARIFKDYYQDILFTQDIMIAICQDLEEVLIREQTLPSAIAMLRAILLVAIEHRLLVEGFCD